MAIDGDELEALFGTKAAAGPPIGGGGVAPVAAVEKPPSNVCLIDPKRANAVANILANFGMMHISQETLLLALLNGDATKLDNPRMEIGLVIGLVQNAMPLPEELEVIDAYDGPREQLRDVEQWLLLVKERIPKFDARAKCLATRAMFSEAAKDHREVIESVRNAAKQIRASEALLKVLQETLAVGNYLNGTSRQGGAWGFKLSALNDLSNTKSVDGKKTLLHYLAERTAGSGADNGPLASQLRKELPCFDAPLRFEWALLAAEVSSLSKAIDAVSALVKGDKVEEFTRSTSAFLAKALEEVADLKAAMAGTSTDCAEMGVWYGEEKLKDEVWNPNPNPHTHSPHPHHTRRTRSVGRYTPPPTPLSHPAPYPARAHLPARSPRSSSRCSLRSSRRSRPPTASTASRRCARRTRSGGRRWRRPTPRAARTARRRGWRRRRAAARPRAAPTSASGSTTT